MSSITKEPAMTLLGAKYPDATNHSDELEYWAWPQVFGSTTGPFGGIGGQAMTTFTIEAWADGSHAVLFCCGKPIKVTDKFQPEMRL